MKFIEIVLINMVFNPGVVMLEVALYALYRFFIY
jgi:predicted GH43/DUF377 family glycosyl hydrolase